MILKCYNQLKTINEVSSSISKVRYWNSDMMMTWDPEAAEKAKEKPGNPVGLPGFRVSGEVSFLLFWEQTFSFFCRLCCLLPFFCDLWCTSKTIFFAMMALFPTPVTTNLPVAWNICWTTKKNYSKVPNIRGVWIKGGGSEIFAKYNKQGGMNKRGGAENI